MERHLFVLVSLAIAAIMIDGDGVGFVYSLSLG